MYSPEANRNFFRNLPCSRKYVFYSRIHSFTPKHRMETSFVFFHNVHSKHTHITPIRVDRSHVPLLKKNISLSNKHKSNCLKTKKNEINACLNICTYAHMLISLFICGEIILNHFHYFHIRIKRN